MVVQTAVASLQFRPSVLTFQVLFLFCFSGQYVDRVGVPGVLPVSQATCLSFPRGSNFLARHQELHGPRNHSGRFCHVAFFGFFTSGGRDVAPLAECQCQVQHAADAGTNPGAARDFSPSHH